MKIQVLLFCIAAVFGYITSTSAQPQTSSKAFNYFTAAADVIVDGGKYGGKYGIELSKNNREALRLIRQGLAYDYHGPSDLPLASKRPSYRHWRQFGRLLATDGDANAAREDWNAAANAYIDATKLGNEITRDGLLIDLLVGEAIQMFGMKPLEKALPALDKDVARQSARRLESIFLSRPSFQSTLQAEFQAGEEVMLLPGILMAMRSIEMKR